MGNRFLLKKVAKLRFAGTGRTVKTGISDMLDVDKSKKGLDAVGDAALGASAVAAPLAVASDSVAKANSKNPDLSKKQSIEQTGLSGARAGLVDGSMAALLHRSKGSLGKGLPSLLKRMAIYGGTGAVLSGSAGAGLAGISSSKRKKNSKVSRSNKSK